MVKDYAEEHPIIVGLAIAAILLVASVGPYLLTLGASTDPRILAALIYALATLFGILFTTILSALREFLDGRRQRRRIAAALLAELIIQSGFIVLACRRTNDYNSMNRILRDGYTRDNFLPAPPPVLLPAVADRLTLFPDAVVTTVVALYGTIEHINRLILELPPASRAPSILRQGGNNNDSMLVYISRSAASLALGAIEQLEKYSPKWSDRELEEVRSDLQSCVGTESRTKTGKSDVAASSDIN